MHGFPFHHFSQPGRGMAVQMQWNGDRLFQGGNQFARGLWREQSCHVLDSQRITPHILEAFTQINKVFESMYGTDGVANRTFGVPLVLLYLSDGYTDISEIIHGIEDTEHIHAVGACHIHKLLHHIVGIVAVAEQVLTT